MTQILIQTLIPTLKSAKASRHSLSIWRIQKAHKCHDLHLHHPDRNKGFSRKLQPKCFNAQVFVLGPSQVTLIGTFTATSFSFKIAILTNCGRNMISILLIKKLLPTTTKAEVAVSNRL